MLENKGESLKHGIWGHRPDSSSEATYTVAIVIVNTIQDLDNQSSVAYVYS